jgi:cbb3-type cytochrome oxidase maturation protein
MSVIVLLIVAGGLVAGGFLAAFVWAVRSGQFDDTHTPAVRVLLDDADANSQPPTANSQSEAMGRSG